MSNHYKILISAWLQFHTNPHLLALNENPNESTKITRLDSGFLFLLAALLSQKDQLLQSDGIGLTHPFIA